MLRQVIFTLCRNESTRLISTSATCLNRVTIIGASGGIGKVLSMLMKADPLVTDLVLMDLKPVGGIAEDLSHMDTFSGVKSFTGANTMADALSCTNLVVVAAGVPGSTTLNTTNKLFTANADLIHKVATNVAKECPDAFLAIIANPINALIPLAAEVLKQNDAYNPKKLFGITKINSMRTRTFIGDYLVVDPYKLKVKVVGGNSETTIVPVISQTSPGIKGDPDEVREIYGRVICGDASVLKANKGKVTAQLSTAYICMQFCHSLLEAMNGKSGVNDVAYVESSVHPDVKFFSSTFDLGKEGIKKFHPMPVLSDFENELLKKAIPELKADIDMGLQYAQSKKGKKVEKSQCKN